MLFDPQDDLSEITLQLGDPSGIERATPFWWLDTYDEGIDTSLWDRVEIARTIYQLERPLPLETELSDILAEHRLVSRPYEVNDADEILRINNGAFDWHPDQANWTTETFQQALSADWVDLQSFRVFVEPGQAQRLCGFCWLRIHDDGNTPNSEIYLIAVDRTQTGLGFGRYIVVDSLDWTHRIHRLPAATLWVESTNAVALSLYSSLGFQRTTTRHKVIPVQP